MSQTHRVASQEANGPPHRGGRWRFVRLLALFVVLGLAFIGYLTPDMQVQWANFVALCGF